MAKDYYVNVIQMGDENKKDKVYKRIGPFSSKVKAKEADVEAGRNLDWNQYFTRIVSGNGMRTGILINHGDGNEKT